jgi:OPA family sugar phosphate sensor protein UhpC-like MFS transporter
MTPLTPAHRSWRLKVAIATWLSYVGFYFCRKPFSAAKSALGTETHWSATTLGDIWACYLIAYSVGQFLASYTGTKLGPRKNLLIGMAVTIAVTVAMPLTLNVKLMAVLATLLGLSQATGWSGNVGTMAGWFHKHERGRVMGLWSTNFNIGALTSGWVMAWVLGLASPAPWRWTFYTGAAVLTAIYIVFIFFQRDRPEDVGLAAIDDPVTPVDEAKTPEPVAAGLMGLSRSQWTNLMLVAGFYFFVKFIRYAIWSWAPYFLHIHYGRPEGGANLLATSFDLLGLPGVWATGWLSDKYFQSRRAGIATAMMIGVTIATTLLFIFYDANVWIFVVLLAAIGFTCYGPDALLTGAGAMDIGGPRRATFCAAVISGFGSMGSIVQELVIPRVYDPKTGSLQVIFGLLLGCATMGALFCGLLVVRNRRGGKGI